VQLKSGGIAAIVPGRLRPLAGCGGTRADGARQTSGNLCSGGLCL